METDRGKGGVRWSETHRGGDGGWRGVRVRERRGLDEQKMKGQKLEKERMESKVGKKEERK